MAKRIEIDGCTYEQEEIDLGLYPLKGGVWDIAYSFSCQKRAKEALLILRRRFEERIAALANSHREDEDEDVAWIAAFEMELFATQNKVIDALLALVPPDETAGHNLESARGASIGE